MRIFISAGEASGDSYGAALVEEIRRLDGDLDRTPANLLKWLQLDADADLSVTIGSLSESERKRIKENVWQLADFLSIGPGEISSDDLTLQSLVDSLITDMDETERKAFGKLHFEGIGGPKLRAAGMALHADSSHWGAISIAQGIRVGFGILPHFWRAKRLLKQGVPGLFIPIDFGFANIRLAKHAKKCGWKVLYFVPPGSWRRHKQGKDLPQITDEIVTPFEWSAEILNKMGAKAHWFGHPIKQLMKRQARAVAPPEARTTVAVLPGSRLHEWEQNLPLIAKAMGSESSYGPLAERIEFALSPSANKAEIEAQWNQLIPGRNDIFTVGNTYGVLSRAKAGVVCSGTATLEAALCRCPMAVLYVLSPAMIREAKLLRIRRPKYISLPNILMDRDVVPELGGVEFITPQEVRRDLQSALEEGEARQQQLRDFEELDTLLGPDDAITKTAELALKML